MSTVWTLFEIGINLFQSVICLYFIKSRVRISKPSKAADIVCVGVCTIFYTLYLFWDIPVTDSINIFLFFIYLLVVSDEPWYVSAFWIVVKEAVAIATIGAMLQLCLGLTGATYNALMMPGTQRLVFVISTNMALFVVLFLGSKMKRSYSPVAVPALLLFLFTNIAVLFAIEMLFSVQIRPLHEAARHIFLAYGALILISILSVLLYHLVTTIVQKANDAQMALNHARLTKQHQQTLQDMYTSMLACRHDFKHQLQTIEQLVRQENSAATEYFSKYKESVADRAVIMTGSLPVDALLTAKLSTCRNRGIDLRLTDCPLNDLPINEVDFCSVIGNLLDNAIEGTCRIQDETVPKWVCLTFDRVWDTFTIRCENNMLPSALKRNRAGFRTTKEQHAQFHGYGIPNIEKIAQSAEGFCSFEAKNDIFAATVILPYPKEVARHAPSGRKDRQLS